MQQGAPDIEREVWNSQARLAELNLVNSLTASVSDAVSTRMREEFSPLMKRVDTLWDERNEQRGRQQAAQAMTAAMVAVGTIFGGLLAALAGALINHLWLAHP